MVSENSIKKSYGRIGMEEIDHREAKSDLSRLLYRHGPKLLMSVWDETLNDMRSMLKEYDTAHQAALTAPELIYQRQEVVKKPRKPRMKKDVSETSQ